MPQHPPTPAEATMQRVRCEHCGMEIEGINIEVLLPCFGWEQEGDAWTCSDCALELSRVGG